MLLHPFEEQLDLPAFPVQIGNLDRAEGKVVREDKNQIPLTVQCLNPSRRMIHTPKL